MSCGATNVKEIEKNGISIVQKCDLVFVDLIQGINKILSAISIPYPLGDPATPKEEQYELREHRVSVALEALTKDVDGQTVFKV